MAIGDEEKKEFGLHNQKKKKAMGSNNGEENHEPEWLKHLLRAQFFVHCNVHSQMNKNECNLFCLDCIGDAICSYCIPNHSEHRIVQIRRSSYNNVIKAAEISDFMDISGVQTYVINSAKIVFLEERPQARPSKEVTHACQTCCRPLLESHNFCSIACKWKGVSVRNVENLAEIESPVASPHRSRRKGIPRRAAF